MPCTMYKLYMYKKDANELTYFIFNFIVIGIVPRNFIPFKPETVVFLKDCFDNSAQITNIGRMKKILVAEVDLQCQARMFSRKMSMFHLNEKICSEAFQ